MLKFRIVRYLAVLFPFALTLISPISEPLKRHALNQYDLRWYSPNQAEDRTQRVFVYNGGSTELPKVVISVNIQSDFAGPVSDFSFASLDSNPNISFFDTLATSGSVSSLLAQGKNELIPVLDSHSNNRNLFSLDRAVENVLISNLQSVKPFTRVVSDLRQTTGNCSAWHDIWLKKCHKSWSVICGQVDMMLGAWEHSKRELQESVRSKWHSATGVQAILPNDRLSPVGRTFFVFPLNALESGLLSVKYSGDPVKSAEVRVSSSMGENAYKVDAIGDLRASPIWIFAKKHKLLTTLLAIVIALSLWIAWEAAKPNKLRPIQQIFNLALRTNDHEFWDLPSQRHRYFILQEVRRLREVFGKVNLDLDPEEVLDFVRASLTMRFKRNKQEYKSQKDLNLYISNQLRFLVLYS